MYSQAEHDKAIFYFDVFRDMCCDIDIQEDADCLVLGNEEEKCSYKLSDVNKVFPQVKTLYIGPNVMDIVIRNAMFPNVKKVISDNPMFASGNMLVKHHVLLNAFYQTDDVVIDLKDVFLIKAFAFNGCRAKKFINTADIKVCSEKAFAGSALLKDNPQPIITAGSILVKIAENVDEIEIPEYITMVMPDIRFRKIRKLCLPGLTHPVTTTVRMDDAPPVMAFKNSCELHDFCMTFKTCKEFEIIGEGAYKSVDGIIYSADMSILVKCPAGREGKIVIPDGVVEIAPGAFSNSCIQEVVFPDSLRKLGMSAFSFCKRLERVDFGRGLKEIGDYDNNNCFRGYDAQPGVVLYIENKGSNKECCYDLDIKDDVTELYLMVFDFCLDDNKKQFKNVSKIVILDTCGDLCLPNQMFPNVKEVISCNNHYVVKQNKLLLNKFNRSLINVFGWNTSEAIDMRGIEEIEDGAFWGCQSRVLENCDTDYIKCKEHAFDGSYFLEQKYMNGVFTIDNRILVAVNDDSVVEIPRDINVAVDNLSFGEDDNKEVIIYDINQLRYIPGIKGKLTIKDTSYLTFLQMQDILNYACRVKELNIVDNPFYCTVNNAVFTKDKKVLVYFQNNIKGRYEIPEGTETIWDNAFYGASLSSVKLPESLCYIHANAFCECKLSAVEFNHTMTHFEQCCGNGIFSSCGTFSELEIPGYVKGLSKNMFSNSKINKLVLNEGLESIESGALSGYTAQEITLPKSLKYVGNYNFSQATVIHVTGKRVPYGLLKAVTSTYSYRKDDSEIIITLIVNDKTYYLPRHMPSKLAARLDELFSFYDVVPEDEIDGLFQKDGMNTIDKSLRQDMMICLYDITKKDCYKQLLKNAKKSIVKRLFENGDEKQLIRFFSFGFFASKSLDNFIKLASEKEMVVLVSYLLEEQKKKSPKKSTKFNI